MNFHAGGTSHWVVLFTCVVTGMLLIRWRRGAGERSGRRADLMFAVLLAGVWPVSLLQQVAHGTLNLHNALPLHLCDVALLTSLVALTTQRMRAVELSYYFALAGTSHGLLTPALDVDWPHPRFVTFFVHHGGVVLAALYLVLGVRLVPVRGSVLRALKGLALYAVVVGGLNWLLGTNYGFLCAKPPSASLLDHLGPWPWYLVVLLGVAGSVFVLLSLPLRWLRRHEADSPFPPSPSLS